MAVCLEELLFGERKGERRVVGGSFTSLLLVWLVAQTKRMNDVMIDRFLPFFFL
jgi:hypothetical protein